MDLTISIATWNVKQYLERCLESIFKSSGGINLEVVVVDNASSDGTVERLREKFPQVKVIENKENQGYSFAHNQVIPLAKGRYILFLNSDTEMLPDTLKNALHFMDDHPEAGACGCQEIADKKTALKKKLVPVSRIKLLWWRLCMGINKIFPNTLISQYGLNFIANTIQSSRKAYNTMEIEYLEAGFLLLRKKALDQAGGFDPQYYLTGDGVDLTMRVKKLGWKIYLVPSIKVIHYGEKGYGQMSASELLGFEKKWQERIEDVKS